MSELYDGQQALGIILISARSVFNVTHASFCIVLPVKQVLEVVNVPKMSTYRSMCTAYDGFHGLLLQET